MSLANDVYNQLVTAYVSKLKNQITLNGSPVPVRNAFGSGNLYITVQGVSTSGIGNKAMTRSLVSVQFRVFVKGDNLVGNEADIISGQLIQLVLPKPSVVVIDNDYFEAIATLEATNVPVYGSEGNTTTKILERNIIIEHRVTHKKRQ